MRKEEDANSLKVEMGPGFTPLLFDVTDGDTVLRAAGEVEEAVGGAGLAGLVNNAGIALAGPLTHQPLDEMRRHFEVNVFGLISVTQAFLPLLGAKEHPAHKPGRIVNVSSVSGRVAESLRRELLLYGIDVIVVRPGTVQTPIWEKGAVPVVSGRYDQTDYSGPLNRFQDSAKKLVSGGDSPERIAKFIRKVFEARKPKTKNAIVSGRFADWIVPTTLPDRWLDRLVGRSLGLTQTTKQRRRR